jgi:hypothetical protein
MRDHPTQSTESPATLTTGDEPPATTKTDETTMDRPPAHPVPSMKDEPDCGMQEMGATRAEMTSMSQVYKMPETDAP